MHRYLLLNFLLAPAVLAEFADDAVDLIGIYFLFLQKLFLVHSKLLLGFAL